jgi:hypothetical protein
MTVAPNPYEDLDECPHGLGLRSTCTLCNGREARERKEARRHMSCGIVARFAGICASCGDAINEGDIICRRADGCYVCCEENHES